MFFQWATCTIIETEKLILEWLKQLQILFEGEGERERERKRERGRGGKYEELTMTACLIASIVDSRARAPLDASSSTLRTVFNNAVNVPTICCGEMKIRLFQNHQYEPC